MAEELKNKKVAILMTDGFEQSEFEKPYEALKEAGATVEIISLKGAKVIGWKTKNWGDEVNVDKTIEEVNAEDYDALMLPGGIINSDKLRMNIDAVNYVANFLELGKPVAAICHAPWILIETGMIDGRKMTSYPSLKTDLVNAGVNWVDEEVVVDNGLLTSRNPDDLPAFCRKMIEEIAEGIHEEE
ncbi:MAG: type 1 glutamine amidotransferase domain-containing protein [Bacteroidia bacterium]